MRTPASFLVAVAAAGLLATARTPGQSLSDQLFDDTVVHDVRILMHSKDLAALRAGWQENTYYPADLVWRNHRLRNIAVRSAGWGSRNPTKMAMHLDFDRYTPNQRFGGLSALTLDNLWQDPSMIRERLAMGMFARAGEPALRVSFARVYLNSAYQGLYALTEPVDAEFLVRALGDPTGYLFEYFFTVPYYGEDLGDTLEPYKAIFQPRTHQLESDEELFGPLRDLWHAVGADEPDPELWRAGVEPYLDLDQFVTHLAIETFIAELDGLLGLEGLNNFYMARPADSTRHRLIVWDKDNAFRFMVDSVFRKVDENVLARRALAFPDLLDRYLDTLQSCAESSLADQWLAGEIERLSALVRPVVPTDLLKPYTDDMFEQEVAFQRTFAQVRPAVVLAEIATLR
jgi:spore coat protein CotH